MFIKSPIRKSHILSASTSARVLPSLWHVVCTGSFEPYLTLSDFRQQSCTGSFTYRFRVKVPFLHGSYLAYTQYYKPLATLTTQSSPHGLPVDMCHAIVRASRVATSLILPACRCQYPGGNRLVRMSLTSRSVIDLPHNLKWVGFRIARFEACSAFTQIPARKFAKSSNDDPSILSASNHVVTSMIRPGCYQPERQLLGRFRTCQRKAPFHGAR